MKDTWCCSSTVMTVSCDGVLLRVLGDFLLYVRFTVSLILAPGPAAHHEQPPSLLQASFPPPGFLTLAGSDIEYFDDYFVKSFFFLHVHFK